MKPTKPHGTFKVTGVGQSIIDLEGITIPLAGEIRVAGISQQAIVSVKIPNALVNVVMKAIDKPVEQIPLYRPELLRLSIKKAL